MTKNIFFLSLLLSFVYGSVKAQDTYNYKESEDPQEVSSAFRVFVEKEGENLNLESAGENERFEILDGDNYRNLARFWGKFTIQNSEDDSVKIVLNIQEAFPDFAAMYFRENGKWIDSGQKTGRMESLTGKIVPSVFEVSFQINLAPGESRELLFLFRNISQRPEPKSLNPKLYSLKNYRLLRSEYLNERNPPNAGFHSILWILLIYNFLIFLISRDKIYLLYSLYMLFASVYMLNSGMILPEILYPDFPGALFYINEISSSLAIVFYILFMQKFLDLSLSSPVGNKIAHGAVILKLAVIPINLIFIYFNSPGLQILIGNIAALICVLVVLGMSIFYIIRHRKNVMSRFFFLGNTVLSVCFVSTVLIMIFYRHESDIAVFLLKFGMVAEILIFSLGLGYRARKNEAEKRHAQQKLIEQLRENEQLQSKVNRELEGKVIERTKEITVQNEELRQQQEEISAQNDFIDRKNRELNIQNRKVLDSIRYAQTIQQAFLPSDEDLADKFPASFVIFRPKDIVSGDFYWLMQHDNFLFLAVSDCTGHGVPGGFMSMIGNEILTSAVLNDYFDPSEILGILDKGIRRVLRQEQDRNDDGMDIGIYVRETDEFGRILSQKFSGAKQSLLIFRAGEILEVRGIRRSAGGKFISKKDYFTTELELQTGDRMFLFSDGMQDQNNHERRKFGKKGLIKMLTETSGLPVAEQKTKIEHLFDQFAEGCEQRDDVTLFGFEEK